MKLRSIAVLLILSLVLIAGCGSSSTPSTDPAGSAGSNDPQQTGTGTDEPVAGGTLIIGRQDDAHSYDPHRGNNFAALEVLHALYDTLVTVDFDMQTIVPLLATKWSVSDDGTEYTFELRDDVKFHSGRPMTAHDVKYSFDRLRDPDENLPEKWVLETVESVEVVDDYTVVLKLTQPDGDLLLNLSRSQAAILDHEAVAQWGEDFGSQWSGGTGPYKWVSWAPDQEIVLERNPDYNWGPGIFANNGAPHVDQLIFRVIPDANTRILALEKGEIHMTRHVPEAEIERLSQLDDVTIMQFNRLHSWFLGMNLRKPVFAEPEVRRALSMAVDRQTLIDLASYGFGLPADNIISPATPGYWEGSSTMGHTYNPEEAKRLLDEAGWVVGSDGIRTKNGMRLSFELHGASASERLLTVLQAQFREIGAEAKLDMMEVGALFQKLAGEDHDMSQIGFSYTTAGEALGLYFHSKNIPAPNRFNWNDPETDRLLDLGKSASNDAERKEAYDQVQQRILEGAPFIPLYSTVGFVAVRDEVQNFKPHGLFGLGFFKLIDPALRR